jgi:hypothetical protein
MNAPRDPGETFIGVRLGTDPFTLLGLPHAPAEESVVLAALGARMADIADHRRSQTPEANEMRLALHAAAAQLLDPQLQELLLHSQSTSTSAPQPAEETRPAQERNQSKKQFDSSPNEDHIRHDLLLVVAANGGWNSSAMRRVALLAHARGIPSSELPSIVSSVLTTDVTPQNLSAEPDIPSPGRTGSIAANDAVINKRATRTGSLVTTSIFAFLTLVSLLIVWSRLTGTPSPLVVSIDTPEKSEQNLVAPQTTKQDVPVESRAAMTANTAARRLTAIASSRIPLNQEQLDQLDTILSALAAKWINLDNDVLVSIHNAVLDIVYSSSSDSDSVLAFIDLLSRDSKLQPLTEEEIIRSTWAIGTLARLSLERNLPTEVDAAIIGHLVALPSDSALGTAKGFEDGVLASLDFFSEQMAEQHVPASAWAGWLDVLASVSSDNNELVLNTKLSAIETLAVKGAEPTQSQSAFNALDLLCSGIVLEPSSPASRKLIDWLGDDRISSADLSVITRVLISKSRTNGIDETLVLPSSADSARRMAIRTELEHLLLGIDAGSTEAIAQWMSVSNTEFLKETGESTTDLLLSATTSSRLASAARATFWGDYQSSQHALANITEDLDRIVAANTSAPQHLGGEGSLDWALRYLSARQNIPIRQALLSELTRGNHLLGSVAAEALVKDAFFGSPVTVRAQAREVVRIHAQSPAVVNAVLEYLPRIPHIDSSSEVIETLVYGDLPAASDPNWNSQARQLLVEALLNLISSQGDGGIVDNLVAKLAISYQLRLSSPGTTSSLSPAINLLESSELLYEQWTSSARAQTSDLKTITRLDEIEMKRTGRTNLADGVIMGFAANQVSTVEVMAIVIQAEHRDLSDNIEEIITSMSERRRSSTSIIEQIYIVENTAVELWRIRLSGGIQ